MSTNYKKLYAINVKNRKKLLSVNPRLNDESGIYFLTRTDEDNINYFYIGQSLHILERLSSHLTGYQHIDLSLRKRGLYTAENPYGWKVNFINYPSNKLDEMEKFWILEYTKKGYQCRYNKTSGSQGAGKEKINEYRPSKGYRDGIKQGRKNMAKELTEIIDKHLDITIKTGKEDNKISQKMYDKFMELLDERSNTES